jgi:hypothetical protein
MSKSKSAPKTKTATKDKEDSKPAPTARTPIDTASGTIVIDGKTYKVNGFATLPTFKIDTNVPTLVMFDGDMVTKPKTNKSGPVVDQDGNPAYVTVAKVVLPSTGEVGQIVCGAVLVRALKEYPGGYVGKTFALTKYPAPEGKAKQWSVVEVSL